MVSRLDASVLKNRRITLTTPKRLHHRSRLDASAILFILSLFSLKLMKTPILP
jgi:hypothetical protein